MEKLKNLSKKEKLLITGIATPVLLYFGVPVELSTYLMSAVGL